MSVFDGFRGREGKALAARFSAFFVICLVWLFSLTSCGKTEWEYKVITYSHEYGARHANQYDLLENTQAFQNSPILPNEKELNDLGKQGWEIVGIYTQYETSFPNFGDLRYVTGIQPNIRPKSVVLILKRKKHS